jgi:hypothetical protein
MSNGVKLPKDVRIALRHYATTTVEAIQEKLPVNTSDSLREDLRALAVDHNIEIEVIHTDFSRRLDAAVEDEVIDSDALDVARRSALSFLL